MRYNDPPMDDEGLNRQFGLEVCPDCGESCDSGCDDECQCPACLDSHENDCVCDGCVERRIEHAEGERDCFDD